MNKYHQTTEPEWVKDLKDLADFSAIILPEQTYVTPSSPPKRLALAVLKEAVRDIITYTGTEYSRPTKTYAREDSFQTAWNWVFQSDKFEWVYPFESVCDLLIIEPNWFRRELKRVLAKVKRPTISFRSQMRGSRHLIRDFSGA